MSESNQSWNFDELSPEARRSAERAADAAGMPLDSWLNQLIKYVSAMELKGEAPVGGSGLEGSIEALAGTQFAADDSHASSETLQPTGFKTGDHLLDELHEAANSPSDPPDSESADFGADTQPPTSLPPDLLSPSRFEEEPPHERDIESAIGGWRRAGSLAAVIVRPDGRQQGRYEIITGTERWHAAKRLKMKLVPVAVTSVSDDELLRATLIERLRRRSLSPIEEARTYQRISRQTGQSAVDLASDIGCAPSLITDALQLLELPDAVQTLLEDGNLTVLHARALAQADDPEALAREVVARQLDIYQTEQLVRSAAMPQTELAPDEPPEAETIGSQTGEQDTAPDAPDAGDAGDIRMIEKNLSNLLGLEVSIAGDEAAGILSLHYGDKRELRELVSRLNREPQGG